MQQIEAGTKISVLQTRCETLELELASTRANRAEVVATTAADLEAMRVRVEEAEQKVREGETERRKLHNQIQELKGNIRVFCRVRPPMGQSSPCSSAVEPTRIILTV